MLADDRVSDANRHEDISRAVDCSLVATAAEESDRNAGYIAGGGLIKISTLARLFVVREKFRNH